jgi:hypothetical protein
MLSLAVALSARSGRSSPHRLEILALRSNVPPCKPLSLQGRPTRATLEDRKQGQLMYLIIAVVLVAMWLFGFIMFKTAGVLIHLLLVLALISLVMHFVTGRGTA